VTKREKGATGIEPGNKKGREKRSITREPRPNEDVKVPSRRARQE